MLKIAIQNFISIEKLVIKNIYHLIYEILFYGNYYIVYLLNIIKYFISNFSNIKIFLKKSLIL